MSDFTSSVSAKATNAVMAAARRLSSTSPRSTMRCLYRAAEPSSSMSPRADMAWMKPTSRAMAPAAQTAAQITDVTTI
ncbi:MAG TPA: hypothetical protein IAC18_04140 [Candidatus Scatomorpha merdipullorum]|uniref:Uncharacterized protein n=1 Tax=Candidatus Scatomorpha merdipullorum TaxID=2840927 RepID=A0A9D1FEA5_9FIRM|nr:hypothetical protein [Candidatus Scatomorpha merdipullorum]